MEKAERRERDSSAGAAGAAGLQARAGGAQLRLVAEPGRALTKAQKRFDRLLRKVETLRAEKGRVVLRWDAFVKVYRTRIHPEEERMNERRKQLVRLLAEHWRKPKGLGKRQREQLEDLLRGQLRALTEAGALPLEDDLRALWEALFKPAPERFAEEADGAAAEPDEAGGHGPGAERPPREIADLIERHGLDPGAYRPGMSVAEFLEEIARRMVEAEAGAAGADREEGQGADTDTDPGRGAARPKSARQAAAEQKAAERAAQREEARKRTVVSIYKQLAKVLHPDLEQDPVLRERKQALMQELTKAHREGDLHTLLRLELEWIKREEGDLERLGDEKLDIYAELLEEQVEELQAEIREVPYEPRFATVVRFVRPFGDGPHDVEAILLSIRQVSESLRRFRDELSGPEGREALRDALREVADQQRAAARWQALDDLF